MHLDIYWMRQVVNWKTIMDRVIFIFISMYNNVNNI